MRILHFLEHTKTLFFFGVKRNWIDVNSILGEAQSRCTFKTRVEDEKSIDFSTPSRGREHQGMSFHFHQDLLQFCF